MVLRLKIKVTPILVPEEESLPSILSWLSIDNCHHQLKRNLDVVQGSSIKLEYKIPTGRPLEYDDSINIHQTVVGKNNTEARNDKDRERGINEAGFCNIPLRTLYAEKLVETRLMVWNAFNGTNLEEVTKGFVKIKADFGDKVLSFNPPTELSWSAKNANVIVKEIMNYFGRCMSVFNGKGATFPSIANLHGPPVCFGSGFVTSFPAFVLKSADPSPEAFWSNAARIAVLRSYPNASSLKEAIRMFEADSADDQKVLTVTCLMCNLFMNACPYFSDAVPVLCGRRLKENPKFRDYSAGIHCAKTSAYRSAAVAWRRIRSSSLSANANSSRFGEFKYVSFESFNNSVRARLRPGKGVPVGGDCEDGGLEIKEALREIQRRDDFTDPILIRMHEVMKSQMVTFDLMGVNGAQLSDADLRSSKRFEELGGHARAGTQPRASFVQMHERVNVQRPAFEAFPVNESAKLTRIQTLEGTGALCSDGTDNERITAMSLTRKLVSNNMAALASIKTPRISPRNEPNRFYAAEQEIITPTLHDEGFSSSYFALFDKKTKTFGFDYTGFINGDKSAAYWSMPEMSEREYKMAMHMQKFMLPIPAFEAPDREFLVSTPASHPILEELREYLSSKKRLSKRTTTIMFIPRGDQLTDEMLRDWKKMFDKELSIVEMHYYNSTVTPGAEMYQINLKLASGK